VSLTPLFKRYTHRSTCDCIEKSSRHTRAQAASAFRIRMMCHRQLCARWELIEERQTAKGDEAMRINDGVAKYCGVLVIVLATLFFTSHQAVAQSTDSCTNQDGNWYKFRMQVNVVGWGPTGIYYPTREPIGFRFDRYMWSME
jgi:hypothetical protein